MATTITSTTFDDTEEQTQARSQSAQPRGRLSTKAALLYLILAIYGAFSLAPFLFAFISSFKTNTDILATPPSVIPHPATSQAYQEIFSSTNQFPHYIANSLIYAVAVTVLNIFLASMAGYAFGRMEFFGKNVLFVIMLGTLMIPTQLIMVPKFLIANSLGLTDNLGALIIPNMATPTSVFLMTQFLKTLPHELEESAMIDGASRFRIFWQVILPLARPALTAVGLFAFQGAWNDFLWPLLVMSHQQNYTLTVGLAFFKGNHYTEYNLLLAGAAVNIAPLVALFFAFQRYFIKGISTAGLAGR